jgi:AcrR family transcriptional regulator
VEKTRQRRQRMNPEDRREQIVAVARGIMTDEGYGALSLRAVAAGCNISLAAVQHHYRDKGELLKQVIETVTEEYDENYEKAVRQSAGDPQRRLRDFLQFLVREDIKSHRSAGFFYELWALAYRDRIASKAMSGLYDLQLNRVRDLVHQIDSSADAAEALARAGVIVAAVDGLMLTIGAGKHSELTRHGVPTDALVDLMTSLAKRPAARPSRSRARARRADSPATDKRR